MISLTHTFSLSLVTLEKSLPFPWTPFDSKGHPSGSSQWKEILMVPRYLWQPRLTYSLCLFEHIISPDEDYNGCKDSLMAFPPKPNLSFAALWKLKYLCGNVPISKIHVRFFNSRIELQKETKEIHLICSMTTSTSVKQIQQRWRISQDATSLKLSLMQHKFSPLIHPSSFLPPLTDYIWIMHMRKNIRTVPLAVLQVTEGQMAWNVWAF